MDDQAIDLTNITVNDQSASAYVEGKRGVAFQRDRAVSIKEIRKNIYQSVPKSRPEDPAFQGKVAKRVRYLTDEEIRREKGVLAKPFKTQAENLIYILTSKAPITTAEAAKELGMKIENVQGLMSKVTLRLGEAIKRERKGLQFVYMPADPAMTHQQLYAEYLNGSPAKMAKAESIKKAEEDLAKLPELPPERGCGWPHYSACPGRSLRSSQRGSNKWSCDPVNLDPERHPPPCEGRDQLQGQLANHQDRLKFPRGPRASWSSLFVVGSLFIAHAPAGSAGRSRSRDAVGRPYPPDRTSTGRAARHSR